MSIPTPPKTNFFNDRQRRQLGQVYSLILSWRKEAKRKDPAKSAANEDPKKGRVEAGISKKTG